MISNNIEITAHITNLALHLKQLINNACQLKLQSGVFGVTSLFISYNIKAKYVCVWRNWYIYHALTDTMSLKRPGQLLRKWRQWLGFWGILSQHLTSTYMVSICWRKELQGKKVTSTYLLGWLIHEYNFLPAEMIIPKMGAIERGAATSSATEILNL